MLQVQAARQRRTHLADFVLEELVGDILLRRTPPGTALDPERLLAERFDVSRLVVRQAIHRLADLGLVRVRQGGATMVLEPDEVANVGIFPYLHRFGLFNAARLRDSIEHQYANGLRLLDVAERRASDASLAEVQQLVEQFEGDKNDDAQLRTLEQEFWTAVAEAGGNHILKIELGWWYRTFSIVGEQHAQTRVPPQARLAFLRALATCLRNRDDVVSFYRKTMRPFLDTLS